MYKLAPLSLALALAGSTAAFAQTPVPPATSPSTTPPTATERANPPMPEVTKDGENLNLTDAEAKAWVDKVVYSSDGKNLGEVAAFAHDGSGKVTELHADIGGFMGLGETRVRILPSQFKLVGERVVISMTGDQAKALPQIAK